MSRGLDAGTVDALSAQLVRPIILFEGVFATGTVRLWSGLGDLSYAGETWQGVGTLGGVSPVQETQEVRANGLRVSLSGIPAELVSLALQSLRQNRAGKIWLAFLPAEGAELLATEAGEIIIT